MLEYLQEFSQKMMSRTHTMQEEVNGLVHEAKVRSSDGASNLEASSEYDVLVHVQYVCLTQVSS